MKKLLLVLSILALTGCGMKAGPTFTGVLLSCDNVGNPHLYNLFSDGHTTQIQNDIYNPVQSCYTQPDGTVILTIKKTQD